MIIEEKGTVEVPFLINLVGAILPVSNGSRRLPESR
ncbi:hypothetical protein swp_0197 [Shewanella piezotolerans WP3]|uniref:Uncharacterized protein n=1 Tax=Shewanella piezotolerans (strain WP3 / JCM 13877) TaxID=225849 RepID=B8CH47_SHEPW|nr:hypothetical protein swp_0197 [Shewanella piezotolerans WP3]